MTNKFILIIFSVVIIIAGCGGPPPIKGIEERQYEAPKLPPRVDINSRAYDYYVNATLYEMLGELTIANRQYKEALKYYPNSDFLRQAYAQSLFDLGRYDEAKAEIMKVKKRNLDTWIVLANCLNYLGETDSLSNAYLNILARDTLNVEAYYRLGNIYQDIGEVDSAIWAYQSLAEIAPSYRIYNRIAEVQIQGGYIEDGKESLLKSIALDSTEVNVPSYINLSIIYENDGDLDQAEKYLVKAVELASEDPQILDRLYEFYRRTKNIEKALDISLRQVKLSPEEPFFKKRAALIYFDLDSLNAADSVFMDLIKSGDSSSVNLYYAGRIALFTEDLDRGKALFEHLTKIEDTLIDGWLNLGLYYRFTDSVDKEIEVYENGLKHVVTRDDSVAICFSAGVTLERADQFERSVDYFQRVIALDPDNSQALNYLGYMYADRGIQLDEALVLIGRALELSPNNGAYLDSYGWALFKLGEVKKAKDTLLLAYEQVDSDPIILEHIGDVFEALGDMDKANKYWRMSEQLKLEWDNKEGIRKK